MKNPISVPFVLIGSIFFFAAVGLSVHAQQGNQPIANKFRKGEVMTTHATGTFEVKLTPQTADKEPADPLMGRMSIDKQFHGDLEGTSKGEMLTGMTAVSGSGTYVAIEKFSGTLKGRSGTFILAHNGTMTRGTAHLVINVVPDSGTGELTGLAGAFTIKIDNGNHSYEFDYTLNEEKKD